MKKIFVCSDIHDDCEALKAYADFAKKEGADMLMIAGDFSLRPYTVESLDELVNTQEVETFIQERDTHVKKKLRDMKKILDDSGIDYMVVPGNYDCNGDITEIFESKNINKASSKIGDAKITGYGGADASPQHILLQSQIGLDHSFDHKELYDLLNDENPDLILLHNPPQGLCDDMFNGNNVGTPAATQYIIEQGPKLVIAGHIHEAGPLGQNPNGVCGIAGIKNPETGKQTLVVNPGNLGKFEAVHPRTLETLREFDYGTFVELNIDEEGNPKSLIQYVLDTPLDKTSTASKLRELEF